MYLVILCLLGLILLGLYNGNHSLSKTYYTLTNKKIPRPITICQLSDFHNHDNARFLNKLFQALEVENPDYIFITGDLIDSRRPKIDFTLTFLKEVTKIAPVFYVSGNHDHRLAMTEDLHKQYQDLGIRVLENKSLTLEKGVDVKGIKDPRAQGRGWSKDQMAKYFKSILDLEDFDPSAYQILLVHRPNFLDLFSSYPIDLILTGHYHGGQIRLPLLGPLLSPHGKFFPKEAEGLHEIQDTFQITSRGLGNSSFPIRINNWPELVVVKLQADGN